MNRYTGIPVYVRIQSNTHWDKAETDIFGDMLAACIAQPSDSLYAASTVLTKKGDQTLRFFVDC